MADTNPLHALKLPSWTFVLGGVATILATRIIVSRRKRNPQRLPSPPGPKGPPIVGNLLQIPQDNPWEGYNELSKEYGDIIYLNALGQDIIVLGSLKRAVDLLEKRAVNYSDRPTAAIVELTDCGWSFAQMQYGENWRHHRRTFHQFMNRNAVSQFTPVMQEEVSVFLRRINDQPEQWLEHVNLYFGTAIMRAAYGFDDIGKNKGVIHVAETLLREFGAAITPGKFLVNTFPILKHIPAWLPGAGFQKHLAGLAQLSHEAVYTPFEDAQATFTSGGSKVHHSIAASLIGSFPESPDQRAEAEVVARNTCAIAYMAGAETSFGSAMALIFALAYNPEVQLRAQVELDSVIGAGRLPLLSDRASLPYIQAIVKELNRWYNAGPLGVPHSNTEDDEYDGYFIPKGTMFLPNVWAIMHDPEVFENPFEFSPERYLKDGEIDPSVPDGDLATFGFGRRICPGRHFAKDTLFLFAASVLSTCQITPPKDEAGRPISQTLDLMNTIPAIPHPFKCQFEMRPGRESLLV